MLSKNLNNKYHLPYYCKIKVRASILDHMNKQGKLYPPLKGRKTILARQPTTLKMDFSLCYCQGSNMNQTKKTISGVNRA